MKRGAGFGYKSSDFDEFKEFRTHLRDLLDGSLIDQKMDKVDFGGPHLHLVDLLEKADVRNWKPLETKRKKRR